jgi:hypothetical protein
VVHIAEFTEAVVRNWDNSFIGIYSAKGVVFSWYVELGEYIVGGGFADVGQADDTHFKSVGWSSPEDVLLLLLVLLFGWHVVEIN